MARTALPYWIGRAQRLEAALEHIAEYWNRNRDEGAMHDALWEIIETAEAALGKVGEQTVATRARELQEFLIGTIKGLVSDGYRIIDACVTRSIIEVEPKAGEWKRREPGNRICVSATFEKRREPRE